MKSLLVATFVLLLAACASEPRYSCGMPVSAGGCRTVSNVYEDSVRMGASAVAQPQPVPAATQEGDALLTRPRVVRVLVLPWEDEAGDLNAGGYVYLRLDRGTWTLAR
jgi:hypothetical protein